MKQFIVIIFSVTLVYSCKYKQGVNHSKNYEFEFKAGMIKFVDEQVANLYDNAELAVSVTTNDSIYYYGSRNDKGKILKVDNRLTLFEIGSISKVFTSHLMLHAQQEILLNIDQPIDDFLEIKNKENRGITLKELSSHSSGLPTMPNYFFDPLIDSINPYKDYTTKILLDDLETNISSKDGTKGKWEYSNYGVSLLGHIIEVVYDNSFHSIAQRKIFDPIGMSYSTTNRNNLKSNLAVGLNENGKPTSNWDLESVTPAGGIISNVRDLALYSIFSYDPSNTLFKIQTNKILSQERKSTDQALGWMIYKRKSGEPYCFLHSGQTGGYTSILLIHHESKKSVSILSNFSDQNNTVLVLGFKLMKELLNGNDR